MAHLSEEQFVFAKRVSQSRLTSDWSVEGGDSIRVWGFVIRPTDIGDAVAAPIVTVTNGSRTICVVKLRLNDAVIVDIPFLADQGLTFSAATNGSNIAVTVFHSHPGS